MRVLQAALRQIFEEIEDGCRPSNAKARLFVFAGSSTLDDGQELLKLDHLGSILVHHLYNLLDLLPVVHKTECDQWVL